MKSNLRKTLSSLLSILCLTFIASAQNTTKWELVWADEFNGSGLPDSAIWNFEQGYLRNNEVQYYTAKRHENARVEDGMLVLEARHDNCQRLEVTSASLQTYGKKSILYGRVEVRAKLPAANLLLMMVLNSFKNVITWQEVRHRSDLPTKGSMHLVGL